MLCELPDEILTKSDLKKVASIMKSRNVEIGLMGFVMKNGVQHEKKYAVARANAAGDDILIESRHVDGVIFNCSALYPQIVAGLKKQLRTIA